MDADNHAGKTQYDDNLIKKAYLFGAFLGDGCCCNYGKNKDSYSFTIISEDKDVIERIRDIVNNLLQKNYSIKESMPNKTKLYKFRAFKKIFYEMLTLQTNYKLELPSFVLNSNDLKIIAEFIAGLMDTDGHICAGINKLGQQTFQLGFTNTAKWLDDFIVLLEKVGVKVGKKTLKKKYKYNYSKKDCYTVGINLRSFVESGLYFNCKRKQKILEYYKKNVRYYSYRKSSETTTPDILK